MKYFFIPFLIFPLAAEDHVPAVGEQAFKTHCAACHMLASVVVGPSLVTVAKTYPAAQREAFVKWAREPGKKNANMIQMPSMAHVSEADLAEIHDYVLASTEGIKNKKGKALYPPFQEPKRALPYVMRTSMPDSSPASVGVVLENGLSVCWDTEACRFRYAYVGDKTNLFNMRNPESLPNTPYYRETSASLFGGEGKLQFLGYGLVEKDPEFRFKVGSMVVRELVSAGAEPGTITRRFKVTESSGLTLDLTSEGAATLTSDRGTLTDGKLTLTSEDAKSFTLTVTKK